ncbi:hypothetical protein G4B88_029558 [Cannabis sativa]|uniref:Uncharacterized protein n=1 Tax=Cannabis sativa TaxID=3483 RepID=A0A7J6E8W2_CANSA|nr:hypothetical protein G4B88_029558 [Cannabis sativa]
MVGIVEFLGIKTAITPTVVSIPRLKERKNPLCSLTCHSQPSQSSGIATNIFLVLSIKLCHKVIHKPVIKIFTPELSISNSSLNLKDSIFNCEKRNIKCATTKIENQNVLFTG